MGRILIIFGDFVGINSGKIGEIRGKLGFFPLNVILGNGSQPTVLLLHRLEEFTTVILLHLQAPLEESGELGSIVPRRFGSDQTILVA